MKVSPFLSDFRTMKSIAIRCPISSHLVLMEYMFSKFHSSKPFLPFHTELTQRKEIVNSWRRSFSFEVSHLHTLHSHFMPPFENLWVKLANVFIKIQCCITDVFPKYLTLLHSEWSKHQLSFVHVESNKVNGNRYTC